MKPASKDAIAVFFDGVSANRNRIFSSHPILEYEQQVRSRVVLRFLGAKAGERVLDIGCGNARDIIPMLSDGARIVGVDLSEGMIQQARLDLAAAGHHDVELHVGDATRLSFPAEAFDKVVCSEVIEHIPEADLAISEMHRVLKPGGCLVLSTPNRSSWYGFDRYVVWDKLLRKEWNHPFDHWRTLDELSALLGRQRFQITRSTTACYVPGFVLTYPLPWKGLQKALIWFVRSGERLFSSIAPKHGYLLVVTAVKKTA